jgi:hypothetical protein
MRGGDADLLTIFNINGEGASLTSSERRGCVLRASVQNLMGGYSSGVQGQIKAPFAGKSARHLRKASLLFEHRERIF